MAEDLRRYSAFQQACFASAALAVLTLACSGPPPARDTLTLRGLSMGTSYTVTVPLPLPVVQASLEQVVRRELGRVDATMSTYREDSELSRFNAYKRTDSFPVSPETFAVFAAAQAASAATDGAFDITIGPLVDAWGFGSAPAGPMPSVETLAKLRRETGWNKLHLDERRQSVRKTASELRCDLSGIAKGYAVDQLAAALAALGCRHYLIEVGGEIRASGFNAAGGHWRIGIERPDASGVVHRILTLSDTAVATSGDYRNFREEGGKRYSHILDPRTGRPVEHQTASATVLDASAMRADAFSTALLVLGEAEGLALAERNGLAALLLVRDASGGLREAASTGFRARMKHSTP